MKELDVRGKVCPIPLIETKKALKEVGRDETLKIIIDNDTSVKNVMEYLTDNLYQASVSSSDGLHVITVDSGSGDKARMASSDPAAWCAPGSPADNSYVVVITKNGIGEGSDELGEALIGSMFHSLKAQDVLPDKIFFLNSGVFLALKDAHTVPMLRDLEKAGVKIASCGTCLDYFGKMDEVAVGKVTNMDEIVTSMREAGRVINI
ncbi:MAG: sulfurtransferase-like selenium metabolism protein YedF [Bacteroidales bacterium]